MEHSQKHSGPGRRFAAGSTRKDQIDGAFGFVSHAILFVALGLGIGLCPAIGGHDKHMLFWSLVIAASVCLIVRTAQVGASTTVESIKAIRAAWWGEGR